MTQDDVRATLARMGHPLSESYYSDFEGGKTVPSPEWQDVFRRLWDDAPEIEAQPEPQPVAATGDVAHLLETVRLQQGYIERLAGAIDQQRQDIAQLADLVRSLLSGGAGTTPPAGPLPELSEGERELHGAVLAGDRQERHDSGQGEASALRVVPALPASPRTPATPGGQGSSRGPTGR
jgi:hypothetical protein